MKKHNLLIATLLVVAAVSAVVVSCKKEDTKAWLDQDKNTKEVFDPIQIDDMNSYLKDFKDKMLSSVKSDDDEVLSLEEAAWHLSSLANYDYGHVNVEYDAFIFDTLYAQVNVTNGVVLLSDLRTAYERISADIYKYYQNLNLFEKHFHFINIIISEEGNAMVSLMITFLQSDKDLGDHLWYFGDNAFNYIYEYCPEWFPEDSTYLWNGSAKVKLEQKLNQIESHILLPSGSVILPAEYYTLTRTNVFYYYSYFDEYGSPSAFDSRLYLGDADYYFTSDDMCYYLDSYAGLGYQFIEDNYYIDDEHPVSWSITCGTTYNHLLMGYHNLVVTYGQRHTHGTTPGPMDNF